MRSLFPAILLFALSSTHFVTAQVQPELLYRSMDQGTGNTRFAEFKTPFMSEQAFFVWLRKLENISDDISFVEFKKEQDELGMTHIKYQQHFNGLPIQAAMLIIHIKDGMVESWNGEYFHGRGMQNFEPHILAAKTQIAHYYESGNEAINKQFLEHFTLNAGFCPIENSSVSIPCYVGDVELDEMNIHEQIWWDAHDIRPIRKLPLHISADSNGRAATHYIGTQNITADYLSANNFRLRETGKRNVSTFKGSANVDFYDTDNYWDNGTDKIAGDVHKGAELVHDFLLDYFNRDSYGNKGDTLKSIATSGSGNAFWNLSLNQATFLVGSSGNVGPCASIDVVGHEYGHGIADESGGLLYSGEACALHESFADITGHMIEHYRDSAKANWYLGEEVWTATMGIRNMEDPHLFKNPKAYGGQYFPQGCHGSGGVQNFWFYLMVKGDTGVNEFNYSYSLKGLGHNKAAQVTYRNMFFYMIPQSTFKDALLGTLKAAKDLYGSCSDELNHTYQAWKAVNVDDANVVTVDLSHGILAPTQVCNGAPATVNLGSIGDKSRKVNWLVNYKDSAASLSYQYTFNKTGFYSIQLTTQTCNKTFVDSMIIAINFKPEPTFKSPFDTSCMIRDTVRFVNTTVNKDIYPLFYEWYVQPTDELYSTKDLNILFKEKLGYTINLKAYYKGGCWNQTQSVIQFKDAVKPSFTVLRNSCQGRPVKLNNTTDTIVNKLKFTWTFPDQSVVDGYLPGDKSIPDYGYFPIILSAEDDQVGCVDTSMAWVEIYRNPEPDFTYDSLCTLADAQLYAGGKFYHTPDWKMWHLGYANPYNKDTITMQVPDSLNCTVGLTISDKRGCNASIYKQLPIHQLHSSLVTSPVCLGDSTTLIANIQTPMAYVAQWKAGDGFSASGVPVKYKYLNPGKYEVQLHIKATHCEATNEVTAEVKDKAFPQFSVQDVCFGDTSQFVNTTDYSGPVDFEWYLGDGSNSTDKSVRHKYPSSKTATYIVKLIAINPDGCSDSISLPHTVNELPECGFTFMRNPDDGNNSFVFTPAAKGQKSYWWKFGDGQTDTRENPVHSYVGNGVYYAELRIENEAGCMCENTLAVNAMYVGTNDLNLSGARIYPNPFSDQIRIEAENTEIEICSTDGKVLLKKSISGIEAIDVSHFSPGTYYLRSSDPSGIRTIKLVKLAD